MKISAILIIILFVVGGNLFSQNNTMWLMNGKKVTINDYQFKDAGEGDSILVYTSLKGKSKKKYFEDVFSIQKKDGTEEIIYSQSIAMGDIFTPSEMRSYLEGLAMAKDYKVDPLIGLGGVFAGLGGAFIPAPEIGGNMEIPVGILVPAAYVGVISATGPVEEDLKQLLPEQANNEHYLIGYQEGVSKKRFKQGLIGAGFGFIVGFFIIATTN